MKSTVVWDVTACSSVASPVTFGGNLLPPSSGTKNYSNKKPARIRYAAYYLRLDVFLHDMLFYLEDGGSTLLRNVSELLSDYTAPHSRR
jgi:hypothetical protein